MTMFESTLRGSALIIAVLGLLDPAVSLPWTDRPVVAVRAVSAEDEALVQRVRARFARDFDVRRDVGPSTRALVLVGGEAEADGADALLAGLPPSPPDHQLAIVAVRPAAAAAASAAGGVRLLRVSAPASLHVASQLRVLVDVAARGQRGRSSTLVLRDGPLELARATHAWTEDDERATIVLEAVPVEVGLARLTVAIADDRGGAGSAAASRQDVAVDVTAQPLRVLFVDARPSWTTRFIRLALAGDARFRLESRAQVSRGLLTRTTEAPPRVTLAALAPFDIVIAGAPELLDAGEIDALRTFARARGGTIVFAPDRAPEGAYVDLLPADRFDERLLDEPRPLQPGAALGIVPAAAATATTTATARAATPAPGRTPPARATSSANADANADGAAARASVLAAELALPRALRPGASTLAQIALDGRSRPAIITSPLGDGSVIFAGALDAWRYRDRDQGRFDRLWRQIVAAFGAQAPAPLDITLDPVLARPGEPIALRAVLRRDLLPPDAATPLTVRARLVPASPDPAAAAPDARTASAGSATPTTPAAAAASDDAGGGEAIRLWPGDRPGELRAALNAPARAGVYAVSIDAESPAIHARASVFVDPDTRRARGSWDGLRALVSARGGLVVADSELDRAVEHVQHRTPAGADREPRHPWRSAWWIVPFAGCLGGEWLLRRRRGDA